MKFNHYATLLLISLLGLLTACSEDIVTVPKSVSAAKAITKLVFSQFNPVVQATIDESTKKITASLPPTADITKLTPAISVSPKAKVSPDSGKVQDFTNPVAYTVTAEDGTTATYTVAVSKAKSSDKMITAFSFTDFSPAVVAQIDQSNKTITATLAATADLTKLKTSISVSDKATLSPASGTVLDFSKAQSFVVQAEDGSSQTYTVTVTKQSATSTATLPSSVTYIDNPAQVSVLKTVSYTWENGILTKLVEKKGTSSTERVFVRDKDGYITQININTDGVKSVQNYSYSADKKTITRTDDLSKDVYTWTYTDQKLLTKRSLVTYFSGKETAITFKWFGTNNKVSSVDDGDLLNTIDSWIGPKNPLWEVAKQTQFLLIDNYNYNTSLLYLSDQVPNSWGSKYSFSSTTRTIQVSQTLDSQGRIARIKAEQSGVLAQDMSILY